MEIETFSNNNSLYWVIGSWFPIAIGMVIGPWSLVIDNYYGRMTMDYGLWTLEELDKLEFFK